MHQVINKEGSTFSIRMYILYTSMPILISAGKKLKFSALVGTAIKSTETVAEMKNKLSACISMSILAGVVQGLKCMHSVHVSSQLLFQCFYCNPY